MPTAPTAAAQRALLELLYEEDGQWFVNIDANRNVTELASPLLHLLGVDRHYPPGRGELEQGELLALDHSPLYPPRKSHLGEQVYAATWKATMAPSREGADDAPIARVLNHYGGPIRQREASVLATVATWLGTAIGSGLLEHAKRLRQAGQDYERAYLIAWTLQNQRRNGCDHGFRTVEYLLAPRELLSTSPWTGGLTRRPDLSFDDLEVIEHFMRWLAEGEGQQFLRRCQEIESDHKRQDCIKADAVLTLLQAAGGS